MFRIILASILLIILITDVSSQFYDFFSAFQPIVHSTSRPFQFDITTKRPKTEHKTSNNRHNNAKITENSPRTFNIEDVGNKEKQKQNSQISFEDYHSTTVKSIRRTTKHISSQNHDTNTNSRERVRQNKTPKDRNVSKVNRERVNNSRRIQATDTDDRIIFNDGNRNTVINYKTTRRYQDNEPKYPNVYTTQYPFTIRPGVKPAIVDGPPITNKPATSRPNFGPRPVEDDTSVSPELIIGPNEDYMNTVEKKRYVELAERMCDKYKALDIKQIQAIPLVPSPVVVKVNVSSCTPTTVPLVVGGKVVTVNEFPHMALLGWPKLRYSGYSWKCGGSLVSNRYVLTAAHCAYQERDNDVVAGAPRAVQLGSSYLNDQNAVIIKVAAVIRHPKYKLPKSYYDLAIVKMTTTVTFSNVIKPACLGIPPPPGKPVIATGWGKTEFGGDQSQELRSVSVPVWDMTECYNVLGTSRKIPDGPSSDSQICAGEKRGGKDTCQGDSGGPAQIQDGCTWRVVAVTSLGRSCGASQTPALYAKVQKPFISAVVFGDQINKNKATTQTSQQSNNQWKNQQWNYNQQTSSERNRNQQSVYNTESNTRQLSSNRRNFDGNVYQNNNRDQENNGYYNQNSNGQYYTNNNGHTTVRPVYNKPNQNSNRQYYNNNGHTTVRPVYNKPQNDYNDYGNIPDYQADSNSYNSGSRTWWT